MGRPNSFQLKRKATILNYPSNSWNSLSAAHKLQVWKTVYDKEVASKIEGKFEHDFSDRFFELAESEFTGLEEGIFKRSKNRLGASAN